MIAPVRPASKSRKSGLVATAGVALCAAILVLASATETTARFGGFGGMGGMRGGSLGGMGGMRGGGLGGMRGGSLGGAMRGGGLGGSGMRSGLGGRGMTRAGTLRGGSSGLSRSGARRGGAMTASRRGPSKYTPASATSKHVGTANSSRIARPTDRTRPSTHPTHPITQGPGGKPVATGPGSPGMPAKPIAPGPGKPFMPGPSGPSLAGSSAAHRPSQVASSGSSWTGCHGSGGVWGHNGSCGSPIMPTGGSSSWGSSSFGRFMPTSWRIPMVAWDWSGLFSQNFGDVSLAGVAAPFAVAEPVPAPSPEPQLQPALVRAKSKLKDTEQGFLALCACRLAART